MALRNLMLDQGRQLFLPCMRAAEQVPATTRAFSDRSAFQDKEEALEKQYMYSQNKKTMEQFAEKVAEKERTQDAAKQELCEILGQSIPQDVMQKLFAWKDKHAKREFWMK